MTSKNIPYIRKLDHLRFFAAWLVGVYHYYHFQSPAYNGFKDPRVLTTKPFSAFIIEGHTGVALFLVLSGFIFAAFTLVALPLLVLFSAITHYVIEKPFFELRRSYLKKKPEVNTNIPAETTAPSPS